MLSHIAKTFKKSFQSYTQDMCWLENKANTSSVFISQQTPFLAFCFVDSRIGCVLYVELFHFSQEITFFEMQNHNSNSKYLNLAALSSVNCSFYDTSVQSVVRYRQTDNYKQSTWTEQACRSLLVSFILTISDWFKFQTLA